MSPDLVEAVRRLTSRLAPHRWLVAIRAEPHRDRPAIWVYTAAHVPGHHRPRIPAEFMGFPVVWRRGELKEQAE